MGTRCNVRILENGQVMGAMYRQFDGYPTGMGQDILNILNKGNLELVNGYNLMEDEIPTTFNGIRCLGAYLIGRLKGSEIGNVYLVPTTHNPGDHGEEYLYDLSTNGDGALMIRVVSLGWGDYPEKVLYVGRLDEFDPVQIREE